MATLLIIEDDIDIQDSMKMVLKNAGYTVMVASKPADAYHLIKQTKPNMIFLDWLLSGYDGMEITRELKLSSETRDIPIIIVSAHPSAAETARTVGANDFLSKPFDISDLLDIAKKYANR